nr:PREDICTED: uncharacterized protein LOC108952056 isoform X1 [Musa acuminata subsp. malaccensis]
MLSSSFSKDLLIALDRKLIHNMMTKNLGVKESFCASTLCFGCNQPEATHSEINAAQQSFHAEQSILLKTSGDGECVQSGDIDVRPNTAESKEQASCLSMLEMHQQSFPAWTLFTTYLILVEPLVRRRLTIILTISLGI